MPPSASDLGGATWTEVATRQPPPLLAVPIGSFEQHGPHLPLDTDTQIAATLAGRLATLRPGVVVAPAVAFGASGEHAGFPGTLSIGVEALEHLLTELIRSADAFSGVVLVNGHGGNCGAVERAVTVAGTEGRHVLGWSWSVRGGDAHAGRTETSLLLAIAPDAVLVDAAARGATAPLAELLPALRAQGVRAVSPNGVLGDPAGATAAEGRDLLDQLTADLAAAVTHRFGPP